MVLSPSPNLDLVLLLPMGLLLLAIGLAFGGVFLSNRLGR